MATVSACLIVRDEEQNLPLCLDALAPFVDEVCVLDTGSRDGTLDVARAAGAVVGEFEWCDDFAAARNASLELASSDWVLVVDADELLDPESAVDLRACLEADDEVQAWLVWIDNLIEAPRSGESPRLSSVAIPRLFRRRPELRYARPVHESIMESLEALGAQDPSPSALRLVHSGYLPAVVRERGKRERNLAILDAHHDSEDAFGAHKLAATLVSLGREGEALEVLRRTWALIGSRSPRELRRLPFLPLFLAELARLEIQSGELSRAKKVIEEGLELAPLVSELIYTAAEFERRRGAYERARALYAEARTRGPWTELYAGDPETRGVKALVGLAKCAAMLGDLGLARDALAEARELSPTDLEARTLEARLCAVRGETREAWQRLGELLEEAPGQGSVALLAAELAWSQGELESARGFWIQARESAATRASAAAWLGIVEALESGVPGPPDFPASDVPEAAARLLISILRGEEHRPEDCIDRVRLLEEVHAWLAELVRDPRHRALRAFQERADGYEGCCPGLSGLLSP